MASGSSRRVVGFAGPRNLMKTYRSWILEFPP